MRKLLRCVRTTASSVMIRAAVLTVGITILCSVTLVVVYSVGFPDLIITADATLAGAAVYRDEKLVGHLKRSGSCALYSAHLGAPARLPTRIRIIPLAGGVVLHEEFGWWQRENFVNTDRLPAIRIGAARAPWETADRPTR